MKELKPYLRRGLTTSCPLNFFYEQTRRKHGQEYKTATISNFQPRIVQSEKRSRTVIELRIRLWAIFTASNFDISSSIFCDAQVKIFHAGSTETILRISTSCSCWDLWQSPFQIVLEALNLFSNSWWLVLFESLASSTSWESPLNSSDLKCVLTGNKQARPECHIINYLLT